MEKKANISLNFEKRRTNLKSAGQTAGRQLTRGRPRSQTGATGGEPIHVFFVAFLNTLQHFLSIFCVLRLFANIGLP